MFGYRGSVVALSALFRPQIAKDAKKLFQRLWFCCHSSHKRVRVSAPAALTVVMQQTSHDVSSLRSVAPSAKGTFNWCMKKLMVMVDGGPAFAKMPDNVTHEPSMDLLLSVRGCGIFAPAVARFLGKPVVKDVLQKLLQSTARVLANGAGRNAFGIEQRKVSQKAECLIAFSCLVRQVCAAVVGLCGRVMAAAALVWRPRCMCACVVPQLNLCLCPVACSRCG